MARKKNMRGSGEHSDGSTEPGDASSSADALNKSDLIRAYLQQHPHAKVSEIIKGLKAEGTDVTYSLVSAVRGKAMKVVGSTKATAQPKASGDVLDAAIVLVQRAGGIRQARELLERLETLKSL